MRNAETVLGVLRERGRRGLPVERLYRQMFNPQWYLLAYGKLYSNKGAMTPGVDSETVDGMTLGKIGRIIDALRHERYRFKPVKRVYRPKKNGKRRPLGLPTWADKLVGEVVRMLLQAYYEPTFSPRSHGFRPGRGCHTALREVAKTWKGTAWFVEGDIAQCFDSFDHQVLIETLSEKIHDNRFLRLVQNMLKAGYLEDWKHHTTPSGVPQGGVLSPILSNIYLSRLDTYVETVIIPEHTRGARRKNNPEHVKTTAAIAAAKKRGDRAQVRTLRQRQRSLPSKDPQDPNYRRLRYIRYADDILLGLAGPRVEAETIKQRLAAFLHDDLKLELSQAKTLVTHGRTSAARFLGYEITVQHTNTRITRGRRTTNGVVGLRVPLDVIRTKCAPYLQRGKPARRPALMNDDDYTIIGTYGAEYRGIVGYYLLAADVWRFNRLRWVMETSLLKTLAGKHDSTVTKMARKHKATIDTPHGPRTCLQASINRGEHRKPLVARFGGIPLTRQQYAVLTDHAPTPTPQVRKELVTRLLRNQCEICNSTDGVQVHHVAKLADLNKVVEPRPTWTQIMIKRRRKTLVVCQTCHDQIHTR
jgi:group II intron reverse transcriptase/maturase